MELKKEIKGLTEQQKKELKEAKTKEELNALVSTAGFELSDDELDAAAGGTDYDSCQDFRCTHCTDHCAYFAPGMIRPGAGYEAPPCYWFEECSDHTSPGFPMTL